MDPRGSAALIRAGALLCALALAACGAGGTTLSRDALMDATNCQTCHPDHYAQWSGSMHAYAAEDPVFRAMNARGQRETDGGLGDFCVKCHAPMATRLGLTKDGLNLDTVPKHLRGVTCYFCHSVDSVAGTHDNPLHLAEDGVMRGGITNPVAQNAHRAAYSPIHDRQRAESATLCGSCHDIVNGLGTAIERTFSEWQATVYNNDNAEQRQTCGKCHMPGKQGLAAQGQGVVLRTVHEHAMASIDVALTDFPGIAEQRALIERDLATALSSKICIVPDPGTGNVNVEITLDNVAVGHGFPSGANQDRRAWAEVIAYSGGQPILQSGAFADDEDIDLEEPNLWLFRDTMKNAAGAETHNFWDATSYVATQLPPAVTNNPADPRYYHAVTRVYPLGTGQVPDRVTVRVRIRPIGFDVLDDLIATGDLDPTIKAKVPTHTFSGTVHEWRSDLGVACVP